MRKPDPLEAILEEQRAIERRGFADIGDLVTWDDLRGEYADVEWAWRYWLPIGFVTMLAAAPGIGKSLFALTVARIVAQGGVWPNGDAYHAAKGSKVLWVETESGEPFHIKRAEAIGLNRRNIVSTRVRGESEHTPVLTQQATRDRVEGILEHPHVSMAIVDSFSGSHSLDENSTQAGMVMKWLAECAKRTQKPILVVHHMNKTGMRQGEVAPTMADIRGSSSIIQFARVVWTLDTPDTSRPHILRLSCLKSNLDAKQPAIGIEIQDQGRLHWTNAPLSQADYLRNEVRERIQAYLDQHPNASRAQIAQAIDVAQTVVADILDASSRIFDNDPPF